MKPGGRSSRAAREMRSGSSAGAIARACETVGSSPGAVARACETVGSSPRAVVRVCETIGSSAYAVARACETIGSCAGGVVGIRETVGPCRGRHRSCLRVGPTWSVRRRRRRRPSPSCSGVSGVVLGGRSDLLFAPSAAPVTKSDLLRAPSFTSGGKSEQVAGGLGGAGGKSDAFCPAPTPTRWVAALGASPPLRAELWPDRWISRVCRRVDAPHPTLDAVAPSAPPPKSGAGP